VIKEGLRKSHIPEMNDNGVDTYANILANLLEGKLTAFISGDMEDNKISRIIGTVVVGIITDPFSNSKNLIIYSLWVINGSEFEEWKNGFLFTSRYALANGCSRIIGYTDNQIIVDLAKKFGADTTHTMINISLEG